ncbi:hypothetical protein IG631_02354 [Alternaria alternata]|nr:hypothetical protein IG631_02354 [Alternaria alternata]
MTSRTLNVTLEAIKLGKANVNTISRAIAYFFTTLRLYSGPLCSASHTASIDLDQAFFLLSEPEFSAAHVRFYVYVWPTRLPLLPMSVETRIVCFHTQNRLISDTDDGAVHVFLKSWQDFSAPHN